MNDHVNNLENGKLAYVPSLSQFASSNRTLVPETSRWQGATPPSRTVSTDWEFCNEHHLGVAHVLMQATPLE